MPLHPQIPLSPTRDAALCMDARMLVTTAGTGVSSYARQLEQAHAAISDSHALLTDRVALDRAAPAPLGRPGRWLRALIPGARSARMLATGQGKTLLFAPDLFRLAQVYFD